MKRWFLVGIMASLVAVILVGHMSATFAENNSCKYCGMEKAKFGHTWMEILYDDGSTGGFCSLHCAAIDVALHIDKTPKKILVGDYNTKKLIDAEEAHWVIGGKKIGVMTTRAKWAFTSREDANTFIDTYGGESATFESAMKAAFEDMYEDVLMIQKKRKMMRMKKMAPKS
jgi:nitrous oxide reductase accessory protein NosL